MSNVTEVAAGTQTTWFLDTSNEFPFARKVGVEITRSADLTSRFFHGPRRVRACVRTASDEDCSRRVAMAVEQ
jgi:hypothetical protein